MQKRLASVLMLLALGQPVLSQQVLDEPDALAPAFILRVDPPLANEINEVLARVAQPVNIVIPAGKFPKEYLSEFCGGTPPVYELVETPNLGATIVRVAPCARIRQNLQIEVTAGDTLEGLAVRNGLPRTAVTRLIVFPSGERKARRIDPENLQVGDVVVIPEVPLWTHFVVNPDRVADRAALVSALAGRLNCQTDDSEACLAEREVTLLDRAAVRQPSEPEPTGIQPFREHSRLRTDMELRSSYFKEGTKSRDREFRDREWTIEFRDSFVREEGGSKTRRAEDSSIRAEIGFSGVPPMVAEDMMESSCMSIAAPAASAPAFSLPQTSASPVPRSLSATAFVEPWLTAATASPETGPQPADASPVPAALTAAMPSTIPPAPEQWPYDAPLLAAILKDSLDAGHIVDATRIGIADGGLGNLSGSPLPEALFDIGLEKLHADASGRSEPDGNDNDWNDYADDFLGAGVPRIRLGELMGTGDLGLCKGEQPSFATWTSLTEASHGALVSSIAGALGLRRAAPEAANALPKLVFFRMLEGACTQDANFEVAEGEMVEAFEYLKTRAEIINISYIVDNASGEEFASKIKEILVHYDRLLVIPAGNDTPDDLDRYGNCPPCLGNGLEHRGGKAARRTLVVGAATRDLHRALSSNYGEQTVGIFAPGESTGALNLAEEQLALTDPTTSYAAPLAALAAGIVRSFGGKYKSPWDIKDRLMATTWPLEDDESRPDRTHMGVLDLVKAAAVRHHAVEVKETEANGQVVRRTYVGRLLTRLKELKLCAGRAFEEEGVHAIRLGEPTADDERQLLVYFRNRIDKGTQRRLIQAFPCRPEGKLIIQALTHDEPKTFDLSEVTQIQLPWVL